MKNKHRKSRRTRYVWMLLIALLLLLLAMTIGSLVRGKIRITLYGAQNMRLEYGTPYEEPGADAVFRPAWWNKKHEIPVTITGQEGVNHLKPGTYEVVYRAEWGKHSSTAVRKVQVVDSVAPSIQLVSDPTHYTLPGQTYQEEGFTATDNCDGDLTAKVKRTTDGREVTYSVTDSSGNTTVVKRTIVYKDPVAPQLTLKGNKNVDVVLGAAFKDPGYTANDNVDGNLTSKVTVSGTVNTDKVGTYTITYTVKDAAGNTATAKRTVKVVPKQDTTKPVITLKGNASMSIQLGNKFTEPGYTASDDVDGNLTSKVTVSGTVNTGKAGTYTITYTVKDAAGNKTVVSRKVQVKDPSAVPDKKVIYLTFDDGPNQNTAKLLPILKKYNVKATFFVSAQFPGYLHLLDDIVNDGHQIALHTKTHSYKQIYKSTDAFIEDLEAIQKIVFDRTGVKSMLMRFPGGSNNTVSKVSMGTLTKLVTKKGFTYFDWNVDSNDAGGARTAAKVYSNVINGCKNKKNSIVLMHDIHSHTVNAVEDILKWGIANGYTFATLDENSPNVQFTKP